jgi:hypothetical protein
MNIKGTSENCEKSLNIGSSCGDCTKTFFGRIVDQCKLVSSETHQKGVNIVFLTYDVHIFQD